MCEGISSLLGPVWLQVLEPSLSNGLPAFCLQGFHVLIASVLRPIITVSLYVNVEIRGGEGKDGSLKAPAQWSASCGSCY